MNVVCPRSALDLIIQFEGYSSKPYRCPAGKATIGYGSTFYANGEPVLFSDAEVDKETATHMLAARVAKDWCNLKGEGLNLNNTNQESALLCLIYNIGYTAFVTSGLYKKIKEKPSDPYIIDEFLRWNKIHFRGEKIPSLAQTRRRLAEATLYFKPPQP